MNSKILVLSLFSVIALSSCSVSDLKFWDKGEVVQEQTVSNTWSQDQSPVIEPTKVDTNSWVSLSWSIDSLSGETLSWSTMTGSVESTWSSLLSNISNSWTTIKSDDYLWMIKMAIKNSYTDKSYVDKGKFAVDFWVKIPKTNSSGSLAMIVWSGKINEIRETKISLVWMYDIIDPKEQYVWSTVKIKFLTWSIDINDADVDFRFVAYWSGSMEYRIDNINLKRLVELGMISTKDLVLYEKTYPAIKKENFKKSYVMTGSILKDFKKSLDEAKKNKTKNSDYYDKAINELFTKLIVKSIKWTELGNILKIEYNFDYLDNPTKSSDVKPISLVWMIDINKIEMTQKAWSGTISIPMIDFMKQASSTSDCVKWNTGTWSKNTDSISKCLNTQKLLYGTPIKVTYSYSTDKQKDTLSESFSLNTEITYDEVFKTPLWLYFSGTVSPIK